MKTLLPYLPWAVEDPAESYRLTAQLVDELGIDGLTLDTLDRADPGLREAIDGVRDGVVFVTEYPPKTTDTARLCSGSTLPLEHRPNKLPSTWWLVLPTPP